MGFRLLRTFALPALACAVAISMASAAASAADAKATVKAVAKGRGITVSSALPVAGRAHVDPGRRVERGQHAHPGGEDPIAQRAHRPDRSDLGRQRSRTVHVRRDGKRLLRHRARVGQRKDPRHGPPVHGGGRRDRRHVRAAGSQVAMVQRFLRQRGVRPRRDCRIHRRDRRGAGRDGVRQPSVLASSAAGRHVNVRYPGASSGVPARGQHACRAVAADRQRAADPSPGPPQRRLQAPPRGRHRLRPRRHRDDGADLLDDPDVPDGRPDSDRGRAEHVGRQPRRERSELLAGVGAVLPHAGKDPDEPRARAAGRAETRAPEASRLQRERAETPRSDHVDQAGARVGVLVDARAGLEADPAGDGAARSRTKTRRKPSLVSAFLAGAFVRAVSRDPAGGHRLQPHQRRFRRAGRQHAGRGIHRAESRPPAEQHREDARLGQHGAHEGDREGEGERRRADAVPRDEQRAVARRPPERRRQPAEHVEPDRHEQAHGAAAERGALHPGEERRSGQRFGGRVSAHREQPVGGARAGGARGPQSGAGHARAELRPGQPADEGRRSAGPGRHQDPRRRAAPGHRQRQERLRSRRRAGTELHRRPRAGEDGLDRPRSQERRLQDPDARLRSQPGALQVAARSAEEPGGGGGQPRQQRPADGSRRAAAHADLAESAQGLAHRDPRRARQSPSASRSASSTSTTPSRRPRTSRAG